MGIKVCCLTALICLWLLPAIGNTSERQEVRFYKINKDRLSQRLRFTAKKSKKAGCHNFLRKARLHRAVQFGYQSCRVFTKKNCAAGTEQAFSRDEPDPESDLPPSETAIELTEGFSWFTVGDHARGQKVRSWYCE